MFVCRYEFTLKAVRNNTGGNGGDSNTASTSLKVRSKPAGGKVTVSPLAGIALRTPFTVQTQGWEEGVGGRHADGHNDSPAFSGSTTRI